MIRNGFTLAEVLVTIAIIAVIILGFMFFSGFVAPFELVFQLAFGWIMFLARVVPQVAVDWNVAITVAVCLAAVLGGLHLFLQWFYRQVPKPAQAEREGDRRWPFRWTIGVGGVVVLMFVSGMAAVGVTHQAMSLATSPEPVIGLVRERTDRMVSGSNLGQLGKSCHMYANEYDTLPPGGTFDPQGKALHGWQTILLPYLEFEKIYERIDLTKPWDDPANIEHTKSIVKHYFHPGIHVTRDSNGFGFSHYAGNARVLGGNRRFGLQQIVDADGTANTLLAGEAAGNFKPWAHPANWRDPALGLNRTPNGFGSPSRTGANFVFADGSVRYLKNTISPDALKALSTPDGGEPPPADE